MAVQRRYLELFLEEGAEILSQLGQAILRLEDRPEDGDARRAALRLAHTLKGGAKMVGLDQVSRAAHDMETRLQSTAREEGMLGPEGRSRLLGVLDRIREVFDRVARGEEGGALLTESGEPTAPAGAPVGSREPEIGPEPWAPGPANDRIRVSAARLDELQGLVDDLALQRARLLAGGRRLQKALRALERASEQASEVAWQAWQGGPPPEFASLRHVARLLTDRESFEFIEDLHRLDQVGADIQDHLSGLRMVPLAEVVDGLERLVRELGRDLGKEAALRVEGKFTGIDKRVLDAVQAPLLHLVRNALDHGIEPPEERVQLGKPRRGEVWIRAYHKGSAVVIEVEDDGRGLAPEEIRDAAVARGVIEPDRARGLGDAEVLYLLCEPGFTTRDAATEVSGRGVGLDVVKAQVEGLKGSVVIQGERGRFARFRLYLPLSISSLSTLIVRVGEERYAIPSQFVDRCAVVASGDLSAHDGSWAHDGRVWPVVSLGRVLGSPPVPGTGRGGLVMLRFRGRRMALHVDALEDEREVVLKSLGRHLAEVPYVLGVSLLAEGPPVPVLNVVDLHARWSTLEATCRYRPGATPRAPVVLVVDDSVTTRHLEKNLLESMGFTVLLAADGADAWRILERRDVDAVLTDIDMPHMDGLELTRRIRERTRWEQLPVVAVTNRTRDADRAAGHAAGVNAYLRKDRFNQRELSETLDGLIDRCDVEPDGGTRG